MGGGGDAWEGTPSELSLAARLQHKNKSFPSEKML